MQDERDENDAEETSYETDEKVVLNEKGGRMRRIRRMREI